MTKEARITDQSNKSVFLQGMRDGIPIGLGYLAVSFSLGIAAKNVGLTAMQGFWASALCNASAGEYAGFTLIGASAAYVEVAIMTLIINLRYMLMSCAMSQRMNPKISIIHRFAMSFFITDELFGIAIARPGYLNPLYTYGSVLAASPWWAIGTAIGVVSGNVLPLRLVSAFSVALYGMFLAVIIPPARRDKVIAALVPICFALSFFGGKVPLVSNLSAGSRTIILTVAISAIVAFFFPVKTRKGRCNNGT